MNGRRSDASTSTDDIKGRPLCLFYFTHPFGVLSPEPPTVTAAPPHVARAFLNMEPVSPFTFWPSSSDGSYNTASSASAAPPPTTVKYDLGKATVHKSPVRVVSVSRARKCTIELGAGRDTLSSSLFSSDVWFSSSSSSRGYECGRRLIPYHRILPPLQLPPPRDSPWDSSDDLWPSKCINREKFSLPPIEMPASRPDSEPKVTKNKQLSDVSSVDSGSVRVKWKKRMGVKKRKRRLHLSGVRRMVTCLMRRVVRGVGGRSPALQEALATVRGAWAEPASLLDRCSRAVTRISAARPSARAPPRPAPRRPAARGMPTHAQLAELPPRPGASPGLMRRRYSVPETIMRKYRLAQQRSESEASGAVTSAASASPVRGACGSCCSPSSARREHVRREALLRRLGARPAAAGAACTTCTCAATRSLCGSRSELSPRPSSAGWATPKRQRLDSPRDFRGSDEMLRTAMRNSYDRAEESRCETSTKPDLSDSTCRSYGREVPSYVETMSDPLTDSDVLSGYEDIKEADGSARRVRDLAVDAASIETASLSKTHEAFDSGSSKSATRADDHSFTDTSDSFSVTMSTAKERNDVVAQKISKQISTSGHIDGRISERSVSVENDESNLLPYDTLLSVDTPSYELLEIVVSESLNTNLLPAIKTGSPETPAVRTIKSPDLYSKKMQNINIDEYVSNILVESLNSLTDQIECMNASIGSDRKVNIIEKEIKVKLQNTGVNTIVHLSPMSNNQIIFGNEELYNIDDNKDRCNNPQDLRDSITIRGEMHSIESNNNLLSGGSLRDNVADFNNSLQNDNVNRAVLQQIQKLFQDELHSFDNDAKYTDNVRPGISHIEISNVDVYIDNNTESVLTVDDNPEIDHQILENSELISNVGAGNYFPDANDNAMVPRFSALPHTDSMEVNTSSSDDPDNMGSDCTSLVDSLDDPNSPRSVFLRKTYNATKRHDLVRSAIDVLDLLPENSYNDQHFSPKDKGESFFIRIKDNDFDCDKENIVVADHMPEKIKQRLYRRHRKREMRMECARRSKVKQLKREIQKQRLVDVASSKKEIEKDCVAIINALIDDVISKIVQDEHKCMRIKQKSSKMVTSKSDENISKRNRKRDEYHNYKNSLKINKNISLRPSTLIDEEHKKSEKHQIHGKLSLLAHPSMSPDNHGPRRFYQKSEIHDGNKCIEILEILEYVNSSQSQSSPDITNSDDSQGNGTKHKKSRIPVPVYEKSSSHLHKGCKTNTCRRTAPMPSRDMNSKSSQLITNMLLEVLADDCGNERKYGASCDSLDTPARRASVPHYEPRSRSNSLRFKRVFDMIPEERSSLSVDSSTEEINQNRRSSAPNLVDGMRGIRDNNRLNSQRDINNVAEVTHPTTSRNYSGNLKETKSAGTSPFSSDLERNAKKSQIVMTSPSRKSAATSPIRLLNKNSNGTHTGVAANVSPSATDYCPHAFDTAADGPPHAPPPPAAAESGAGGGGGAAACGKRGLASRGRAWLGFTRPEYKLHEEGSKEKIVDEKGKDRRSTSTRYDREIDSQRTVRTIQTETVDPIIVRGDRCRDKSKTRRGGDERRSSETKPKKRTSRTKSESRERPEDARKADVTFRKTDKRKIRTISMERSEEETIRTKSVKLPECHQSGGAAGGSSSSSESGGSLLCSLAPKWLAGHARQRRAGRRRDAAPAPPAARDAVEDDATGGWSVTVAGSCRAALPADVEMRLRFPPEPQPRGERAASHAPPKARAESNSVETHQEWSCVSRRCPSCACACCAPKGGPMPLATRADGQLTLTMKKEASGSSVLATKTAKKSTDPLPDLETYRAARSKMKSSVKTRRGYSLHCWLPDDEPALARYCCLRHPLPSTNNGLSVLGSAIIPELKPRVPTMSERDLTRVFTPRHYLRS